MNTNEKSGVLEGNKLDKIDVVVIEDDKSLASMWASFATNKGKKVDVYHDRNEFLKNRHKYSKDTRIIVNYGLNKTPNGVEVAIILGKEGFSDFYMTTGCTEKQLARLEGHRIPSDLIVFDKAGDEDFEKMIKLLQE